MRAFVLVPIVLAIAVAIGFAICRAIGFQTHTREMIAAAMACLVAAELAGAPLVLARGADQAATAQAALVGTVIHLFISVAFAAVVILGHVGLGPAFLYWLLGLYWVSLVVLVAAFSKAVRSAPITQPSNR